MATLDGDAAMMPTMRIGLALPQYDFSVPGESPLRWETVLGTARRAEALGFDSLWLSDHLFLGIEKYGGGPGEYGAYEPIVTLAALARETERVRLGTLVLCEALRPATVLAKALASLDRITGGRLDVGIGAGWYEPEYDAIGLPFPPPGVRLARLAEAVTVLRGLLPGGPFSHDGTWHVARAARNLPAAVQTPRPPIIVGGKGDRLLRLVAELADGWNTCWAWTPDNYAARVAVLERACERVGRDPATVTRSLGLSTLIGEDERDLVRRYERLQAVAPNGMLADIPLATWRTGRLVGTVEQVHEQVAGWAAAGVVELIIGLHPLPFSLGDPEDLELAGEALAARASNPWRSTLS